MVSDSYSRCDWIVIGCDGLGTVEFIISSVVELFWNHLKAVGINPEFVVHLEVLEQVPVSNDVFTSEVQFDWDFVEGDLE